VAAIWPIRDLLSAGEDAKTEDAPESKASVASGLMHEYQVRPRKDHRGFDLISDALAFGRLWYDEPNASQQRNRLRDALQPLT